MFFKTITFTFLCLSLLNDAQAITRREIPITETSDCSSIFTKLYSALRTITGQQPSELSILKRKAAQAATQSDVMQAAAKLLEYGATLNDVRAAFDAAPFFRNQEYKKTRDAVHHFAKHLIDTFVAKRFSWSDEHYVENFSLLFRHSFNATNRQLFASDRIEFLRELLQSGFSAEFIATYNKHRFKGDDWLSDSKRITTLIKDSKKLNSHDFAALYLDYVYTFVENHAKNPQDLADVLACAKVINAHRGWKLSLYSVSNIDVEQDIKKSIEQWLTDSSFIRSRFGNASEHVVAELVDHADPYRIKDWIESYAFHMQPVSSKEDLIELLVFHHQLVFDYPDSLIIYENGGPIERGHALTIWENFDAIARKHDRPTDYFDRDGWNRFNNAIRREWDSLLQE